MLNPTRGLLALLLLAGAGAMVPAPPGAAASDGVWSQLAPPNRLLHSLIHDPVRQRLVLFAGNDGIDRNDVWVLSLSGPTVWTKLTVAGTPPPTRTRHMAIYDSARDRMVIYGGRLSAPQTAVRSDVWALSFSGTPTWTPIVAAGTSAPRYAAGAVYDPIGDRMVVVDGLNELGARVNQVRALSFGATPTWTDLSVSGTPPSDRFDLAAVYDPNANRVLVFGGQRASWLNDVWELTLGSTPMWTPLAPAGPLPPARRDCGSLFDASRNRMVIFGGSGTQRYNDSWALNLGGGPTWEQLLPAGTLPSQRTGPALYDVANDRLVHFGGSPQANEVWALSFGGSPAWMPIMPWGPTPPGSAGAPQVLDPVTRRVVMFSGDLWSLSLAPAGQWSPLAATGGPPPPRTHASMIYDPVRARAILFGGRGTDGLGFNDLWTLSLSGTPTWSPLVASGTPPDQRQHHTAIYDPVRDRMIVYGGDHFGPFQSFFSDVWALSLSGPPVWEQLFPFGYHALSNHTAIYDPLGDRMLVFGGNPDYAESPGSTNEVWALPLATPGPWTQLYPTGALPPPNELSSAVYDPNGARMLAHVSGMSPPFGPGTLWELSLTGTPAWRALALDGDPGPPRYGGFMAMDPVTSRLVVDGGDLLGFTTWFIGLESEVTEVLASLVASDFRDGAMRLRWLAAKHEGEAAHLGRSADGTEWRTIGDAVTSGTGFVEFADVDVEAGRRYAYRIGYEVGGVMDWSSASWVEVPASGARGLAIERLAPNPSAGEVDLTLGLAAGARGSVDLIDVAGRVVATREVSGSNAGPQRVSLRLDETLAPGLYVVRFTSAGRSTSRRLALVR